MAFSPDPIICNTSSYNDGSEHGASHPISQHCLLALLSQMEFSSRPHARPRSPGHGPCPGSGPTKATPSGYKEKDRHAYAPQLTKECPCSASGPLDGLVDPPLGESGAVAIVFVCSLLPRCWPGCCCSCCSALPTLSIVCRVCSS